MPSSIITELHNWLHWKSNFFRSELLLYQAFSLNGSCSWRNIPSNEESWTWNLHFRRRGWDYPRQPGFESSAAQPWVGGRQCVWYPSGSTQWDSKLYYRWGVEFSCVEIHVFRARDIAQRHKWLPSKCKVLGSICSLPSQSRFSVHRNRNYWQSFLKMLLSILPKKTNSGCQSEV